MHVCIPPAPKLMPNASVAWRDSGRPPTATLTTDSMAALPAVVHTSTIYGKNVVIRQGRQANCSFLHVTVVVFVLLS
eukprot:365747-Chlamydomonas_euryale.AAC.28